MTAYKKLLVHVHVYIGLKFFVISAK